MKITEFENTPAPNGLGVGASTGGDLSGPLPTPTVTGIGGSPIEAASPFVDGDVLIFDSGSWVPGPVPPPDWSSMPPIDLSSYAASDLGTRWEPMTNGLVATPEILFAGGDVIMVEVPT